MQNNIPICLPANVSKDEFLGLYWQKKPLLIRQGLPQLIGMFEPDDILGLAIEPEVTARLLKQSTPHNQNKWTVEKSPFNETIFADLPELWTILIQNLEQWSPQLGSLWQAFDQIPQWQRDDIMVSYAPKNGSVGMHYDDYDVFLAQGYGSRRWQLGKYCDEHTQFVPDQPLKLVDDMGDIFFDEILYPGDVLYVPPKLSHYGIANEACLTFSFGFRRPNLIQIVDSLVDVATTHPIWFAPLQLEQSVQPSGKLDAKSVEQIKHQLLSMLNNDTTDKLLTAAIAEVVSKRAYDILTPEHHLKPNEVREALFAGATLKLDNSSKLIYTEDNGNIVIFANGQQIEDLEACETILLKRLANGEQLTKSDVFASEHSIVIDTVISWLENGWVWLAFIEPP